MSKSSTECVKVMVRVRPMNTSEKKRGCKHVVQCDPAYNQINIHGHDASAIPKTFQFDQVYDVDSLQQSVYDECAFPLVESVLKGYNGTIFAYGQTGCGKTFTMMGVPDDETLRGLIPNCFAHIFGVLQTDEDPTKKFLVRCSYLEIYNEDVFDLLVEQKKNVAPEKLDVKEDKNKGVFVAGLTQVIVQSIPEMEKQMLFGTNNRKTASTAMNAESSRSHSIFTIYIETASTVDKQTRIKAGKLNLVDLAGSERTSKTGATGQTMKEGIKINLSLNALGNVIGSLVDGKSTHIPYRDSRLTRLLQDSLGGNTKTVMIAACSPADYNYEESLSTLRFAARAKSIKNKPRVNEDPKDALLKKYEEEITELRKMLQAFQSGKNPQAMMDSLQQMQQQFSHHSNVQVADGTSPQRKGSITSNKGEEMSVAELLAKLEQKGKKIQVLDTPDQTSGKAKDLNGHAQSNGLHGEPTSAEMNKALRHPNSQHSNGTQGSPQMNGQMHGEPSDLGQQPFGGTFQNNGDENCEKTARAVNGFSQESPEVGMKERQMAADNATLKDELRSKEKALEQQAQQQKQLEEMISAMEKNYNGFQNPGQENTTETKETSAKAKFKEERQRQLTLKRMRKQKDAELKEKLIKDEQQLLNDQPVETDASDCPQHSETIANLRKVIKKLQVKYQQQRMENQDLIKEFSDTKQELMNIVRFQEKDLKFNDKVINMVLSDNEKYKLKHRAQWNESLQDYVIPQFFFNYKENVLAFPTINAKARCEQAKEERDVYFKTGQNGSQASGDATARQNQALTENNQSQYYDQEHQSAGADPSGFADARNDFFKEGYGRQNSAGMRQTKTNLNSIKKSNRGDITSNGEIHSRKARNLNPLSTGQPEDRNGPSNQGLLVTQRHTKYDTLDPREIDDALKPSIKKRNKRHQQQQLAPLTPTKSVGSRNMSQQPILSNGTDGHPINWAPVPTSELKPPGNLCQPIKHNDYKINVQNYNQNLQEESQYGGRPSARVRDLAPLDPHKKM